MKNLKNLNVTEIKEFEAKCHYGGSWIGEGIGTFIGAVGRYYGPVGALQFTIDYAMSKI